MTVEEKIQSILIAASGVTAICPAARILVPGDWQDLERPYLIHFPVAVTPTHCHDGLQSMRIWDYYQVSCVGDTYSSARALAEAVIAALGGNHNGLTALYESEVVFKEPDTRTEQIALNFRVAYSQT